MIYQELLTEHGPQDWWPVHDEPMRPGFDPTFEIMVGTILTQNTAWRNVEKAIEALFRSDCLDVPSMCSVRSDKLKRLIKPSGYFNAKAKKLKILAHHIRDRHDSNAKKMARLINRDDLLALWGVGPETADSILLYAGDRPEFVIDTYTKRLCAHHGIEHATYDEYKQFFENQLNRDAKLYNEYHALIVKWGKNQPKH